MNPPKARAFFTSAVKGKVPTDLFPHLGIPTVWMMYTATWKKKTKKKKKKLKELSDLEGENRDTRTRCYILLLAVFRIQAVSLLPYVD